MPRENKLCPRRAMIACQQILEWQACKMLQGSQGSHKVPPQEIAENV